MALWPPRTESSLCLSALPVLSIHSAWLLSLIIKLAVIFLTGLQTLISFHSESQSAEGIAAAEPEGTPFPWAEPTEL